VTRRGWLFLTSTPPTRQALLPLLSLWLDTLVLRLMEPRPPGARPVWFVLDELASLQRLPQLHTAIRRTSQIPQSGGARFPEPQPARDAVRARRRSDAVATREEDLSRDQRAARPSSTSFSLERQVEPMVMASEIMGLPPFHGYLKSGNLVVRLKGANLEAAGAGAGVRAAAAPADGRRAIRGGPITRVCPAGFRASPVSVAGAPNVAGLHGATV
jgi:hypothetical protein